MNWCIIENIYQQIGIGLRIVVLVRVNNDCSRNQVIEVGPVREQCGDEQPGDGKKDNRLVARKFVHWGYNIISNIVMNRKSQDKGDCVKTNTSGFVNPTKVGRRLDSARIQFMFAGFGSPLSRG
jgi:hypothetical protein